MPRGRTVVVGINCVSDYRRGAIIGVLMLLDPAKVLRRPERPAPYRRVAIGAYREKDDAKGARLYV